MRTLLVIIGLLLMTEMIATEPPGPKFAEYELVPEERAAKVDTEGCVIQGKLNKQDKSEVLRLIARIKGIYRKVQKIQACFDDYTVAVVVWAGDREVYCTRDSYGRWQIIRVFQKVP